MIAHILKGAFRRFGRRYAYDITYLDALTDASVSGALKLAFASGLFQHRFGLAPAPHFAAKFAAARATGCGPCVLLVIAQAAEAGVPREMFAALSRPDDADKDMSLAADFARAVCCQSPDLPELQALILERFGARGRVGLAMAAASGQFFPVLKRGMAADQSCDILPLELRERREA